ncbi:hypothetical protein RAC89_02905 [Paenibacillus sp. GD4]|uniref:hypothetical protein n=1 Tax=Paenibacillus sp. GD4 TaxID=3068890 RepID=UPI00279653E4|nr:hypothetical protein [Paenibacillus sp. GD4]MDQ1909450.1 hypothetical protein [Paenibacillus sp. GD4]
MRLGAFFLGGIVGAAATIYLSNKNKNMMMSAFSSKNDSFSDLVDQTVDKAKKTFIEFIPENKSTSASASGTNSKSASASKSNMKAGKSDEAGLDRVEDIVAKEPKLKSQVDEILSKNGEKPTSSYQLQ